MSLLLHLWTGWLCPPSELLRELLFFLCTVVDKHVILIRLRHFILPRPKREQPIGKHRVCHMSLPALPLQVLRSLSSIPFPFYSLNSSLPRGPCCLPQVSGALGELHSFSPPDLCSQMQLKPLSVQRTSLGSTAAFFLWDAGQLTAREWSLTLPSAVGR